MWLHYIDIYYVITNRKGHSMSKPKCAIIIAMETSLML